MNHLRVFYRTTTAVFTGLICGSFSNKLKHKFLQVHADPSPVCIDDLSPIYSHDRSDGEIDINDVLQTPLDGREVQRGYPTGSPSVQGWIHPPGSCEWVAAIAKPGGLGSQWLSYEKGGHVFPHFEVPKRIVLDYKDFLLCFDTETKTPIWVLEEMTVDGLTTRPESFKGLCRPEERVPKKLHPLRGDYFYGKDKFKPLLLNYLDFHKHVIEESFVMTGLAPKIWKQVKNHQEHQSYDLWDELYHYINQLKIVYNYDQVFALSGPLYLPKKDKNTGNMYRTYQLMGESKIGVPTHFFKVIVAIKNGHMRFECFKFENKPGNRNFDLRQFTVPREQLEKEAGFTIFKEIEDSQIKSKCMEPKYVNVNPNH